MREQILQILGEMRAEAGPEDGFCHDTLRNFVVCLTGLNFDADEAHVVQRLRQARSLMLDILLRLRHERLDQTDRRTELEADKFWDGCMREHFVEDAEELAAKPAIRDLYREVNEDEESGQPINDFLNNLDHDTDQDLGMFVYNMLTSDAQKATI
jgi:hypothetical protein